MRESLDLMVIGSGPGGYRAAIYAALRGLSVGIVEEADWGGTCLNRGCIPKKDWHYTAKTIARSAKFADRGIAGGPLRGDLAKAWTHQERVVAQVQESYVGFMDRLKVRKFRGRARLDGDTNVVIDGPDAGTVEAANVILATGSRPAPLPGVEPISGKVLTTDMLFDEEAPPAGEVIVAGSGIIGTEMAFILAQLGCSVTWVASGAPLRKTKFTPQARGALEDKLREYGIEWRTGGRLAGTRVEGARVLAELDDGAILEADWLLLGTGREPVTTDLGLGGAGVETDGKGYIQVDAHRRTTRAGIYAIGDCANRNQTANHAMADAVVAVKNILEAESAEADDDLVPEVVYSALEMARVGLDDDEAEDAEYEPAVGFTSFETNPKALGQDTDEGFTRLLADMDEGILLGGEIIGDSAGELIHILTSQPDPETALNRIAQGKFNHPAMAEEVLNSTETLAANWGLGPEIFGE
ncbi:dihydrolipoyl dehydrogenase family protein [Thiohalorhabdus sp. Cl-TMA]|uniref:Dihydrolipoyl dehydrogenase n=1 Tax=Thiohalorhabdus methylotrophus TaxID=3242694 RepID=A0ABV4TRZ0_9GAMM